MRTSSTRRYLFPRGVDRSAHVKMQHSIFASLLNNYDDDKMLIFLSNIARKCQRYSFKVKLNLTAFSDKGVKLLIKRQRCKCGSTKLS